MFKSTVCSLQTIPWHFYYACKVNKMEFPNDLDKFTECENTW